jgi:TPR repeat protein
MKIYKLHKIFYLFLVLINFVLIFNPAKSDEKLDSLWTSYFYCSGFSECLHVINKVEDELKKPIYINNDNEINWLNFEKGSLLMRSNKDKDILLGEKYLLKLINNKNLKKNPNDLYYYSHVNLGWAYHTEESIFNPKKAIKLMEVAADYKIPQAINNLGAFYEMGLGVKKNYKKSLELYSKASKLGSAHAHSNIGKFYILGYGGLDKNFNKAINHYKLSTISLDGQNDNYILKLLYTKNILPKNLDEFIEWMIEEAKIKKDPNSFLRIAFELNYTKDAYFWYYLCSEFSQLSEDIKRCQQEMRIVKKIMGNKLNDEEIKNLKKRANDWYNQFIS